MILGEVKVYQAKHTVVLLLAGRAPLHHLCRDTAWSAHSERSASTLLGGKSFLFFHLLSTTLASPSKSTVLGACSASFVPILFVDIAAIFDYKRESPLVVLAGLSGGVAAISVFFLLDV